ncbi:MAG: GxxExxY protein [Caldilineaceae bacterium]|nr:GxxExxY protein [Caldilineaceae bacterium]
MTELLHRELVYYLQGVGFRIHNALKGGHNEVDYEESLAWVLQSDNIKFVRQPTYPIFYKEIQIGAFRPDLVVGDNEVLPELKVAPQIEPMHLAQTLSYLGVTGADLGLVMNFGASSMQYKRLPNFLPNRRAKPAFSQSNASNLLFPELTRTILNALYEVHHLIGPGFLHQVYRRAVRVEIGLQGVNHKYVKELPLRFERIELGMKPVHMFWAESKILIAVWALQQIKPRQTEKLRWVMRQLGCPLGLIANFYPSKLDVRFIRQ